MRSLRSQAGFTITEMLIATAIMMAVTGGVFTLMNPAQGTFQAQPEVDVVYAHNDPMAEAAIISAESATKFPM